MRRDVEWLCAPERAGRGANQPGGRQTARWLEAQFSELGYEIVRQPIERASDSIFAIKRAGPRAVIVSAHYDHLGRSGDVVYPGADDNASGVAVLLAMAREAASRPMKHTVIFASFSAEEWGLVGSEAYVRDPVWPLARTVGVINFDMVGRNFFEAGANKPSTAAVVGLQGEPGVYRATRAAARDVGLALVAAPAGLVELFGYDNRTDDWWFRRRGVLAIHFSTGMHEDYHEPSDSADKLRYDQMEKVARTAFATLAHLAEEGAAGRTRRSSRDP